MLIFYFIIILEKTPVKILYRIPDFPGFSAKIALRFARFPQDFQERGVLVYETLPPAAYGRDPGGAVLWRSTSLAWSKMVLMGMPPWRLLRAW